AGCKGGNEDKGEKQRPHRVPPVVAGHLALSKAMPKPSSGRLISIGFLLASCTVILRSLPARMAAMNLSVSVMARKHPTLVQVWMDGRSAVPLPTFTKTGSVRLRPSGSVITIAPVLPSAAGRTSADATNCRVSRWKTCWTARQSSVLPSPAHSTRHAAGVPSGACCARADCAEAIKMVSAITAATVSARLPAAKAWRLADIWGRLLDCDGNGEKRGRRSVLKHAWRWFDSPTRPGWSLRTPGRPNTLTPSPTDGFFFKRSRLINAGWKHEYPRNRASVHRAREVFHAYRHPRLSRQGNADEGEAQGLAGRRRRRPRHRNGVLVGSDRLHRQRRAALHRRGVSRPRSRPRPVERQWSALPGRRRPHHAPAEAGGADPARASPSGAALPA